MLIDTNTYKKEKWNVIQNVQESVNILILSWFDSRFIESKFKNKLTCFNGKAPYIYGLPKILKVNTPLRPIVSNAGAPTNCLSTFLSRLEYVKSSYDFHNFNKNKIVPSNHILTSFDGHHFSQLFQ